MEKMLSKILNDVVMTTMKVSKSPVKIICDLKVLLKKWKLNTLTGDEFVKVKCVAFLEEIVPYFNDYMLIYLKITSGR